MGDCHARRLPSVREAFKYPGVYAMQQNIAPGLQNPATWGFAAPHAHQSSWMQPNAHVPVHCVHRAGGTIKAVLARNLWYDKEGPETGRICDLCLNNPHTHTSWYMGPLCVTANPVVRATTG